jgi:adenylate kinase family enzyme
VSATATAAPRRIHIYGGPGSGKTRLALELGERLGLPVHHLDEVARVGGGHGQVRSPEEREQLLREILGSDAWITEGVHLLWTDPILERADVVIWLDYVSRLRATRRIVKRFAQGAAYEMRHRSGRERFTRFGDYARHARFLVVSILETRDYYAVETGGPDAALGRLEATTREDAARATTGGSRLAATAQLAAHEDKLIHCRTAGDVAALARRWA